MKKHRWFVLELAALFAPRLLGNWLFLASFALLGFTSAQAALNDTGIKTCSNATQNGLPCPVAGFPGQDAEYGTNSFNFTKLDAAGNALPVTATNHSCVRDNVTGLIWEVKANDGGLRDKDNTYSFNSTAQFAEQVNATGLCGFNDWRVPSPQELVGIVDYSSLNPKIDANYFPDDTWGGYYWTTAGHMVYGDVAWSVDFHEGYVDPCYTDVNNSVRLVRGKSNGSGLIWGESLYGMTWEQALNAAKNSTFNGYSDWRVPNVKEMQSILSYNNAPIWMPSDSLCGFYDSGYVNSSERDDANLRTLWLVRGGLPPAQPAFSLSVTKTGSGTVTSSASVKEGYGCVGNATPVSSGVPVEATDFRGWQAYCIYVPYGASLGISMTIYEPNSYFNLSVNGADGRDYFCDGTYCSFTASTGGMWRFIVNGAYAYSGVPFAVTATVDPIDPPDPYPPTTITDDATNITDISAVLNGTVNPNGYQDVWAWFSIYDLNQSYYGTFPETRIYIPADNGFVSADATGLNCGTTYNYHIVAEYNSQMDTVAGEEKSFTTAPCVIVTPIIGPGGTVNPSTPQTVNSGSTASFTVTPNPGYAINPVVGGTCPQGSWSGNVWIVGSIQITANCTVSFSFTKAYIVTPLIGTGGGTVNPSAVQTVASGSTASFIVTPNTGYITNPVVSGTCPQGSWNGNVWTTGAIIARCTVKFGFQPIKLDFTITGITLTPTSPVAGGNFDAAIMVKSKNANSAGDAGKLVIWTNQPTVQGCGAVGTKTVTVGTLAVDEVKTIAVTGLVATTSKNVTQTLRAFVDGDCGTVETNEANNQLTKTYKARQSEYGSQNETHQELKCLVGFLIIH